MLNFMRILSLVLIFANSAFSASFTPRGSYSDDVVEEIQRAGEFRRLNLQNKPLVFATDDRLFDQGEAAKVVAVLPATLEILDLSLNRLPEDALSSFIDVLQRDTFKYLDVTINSGADTLEGLRLLTTVLGKMGVNTQTQAALLKKIIWVQEGQIEELSQRGVLFGPYAQAHRDYYRSKRIISFDNWSLPATE